ncbi:DHHC palmitoyltransferase-domain-containing protein [Spinellus fusiger]|nr:DHHC palmitoyltransferase-domain-containing protein [Spinellus fusiger]
MDHHCPWINGCVGYRNYKYFCLFIFYTGFYGLWIMCSGFPIVMNIFLYRSDKIDPQWIVLLLITFLFGMTMCGFSVIHIYYVTHNESTIEHINTRMYEIRVDFDTSGMNYEVVSVQPDAQLWDRGAKANWCSVFGDKIWMWFLPMNITLGDGLTFLYNPSARHHIIERALHQRTVLSTPESTLYGPRPPSPPPTTAAL